MQYSKTRKNSLNTRYHHDSTDLIAFKSSTIDTKTLKDQLNHINNQRKSLTRQSLTSSYRMDKENYVLKKEQIVQNLVNKLENEEELRHIIEKRFKKQSKNNDNQSIRIYAERLRSADQQVQDLKRLLQDSDNRIRMLEEERLNQFCNVRSKDIKRRTKERGVQTDSALVDTEIKDEFLTKLQKTIEALNGTAKYSVY